MNHFILLIPVVLVNIFYGKNNGVQKVYLFIFLYLNDCFFSSALAFTLKGKSDFALQKFLLAGTPETFHPYYGVKDPDIFKSENLDALHNYVNKCTMHNGVHIVMADGVT
jgi:hypothetical protein